MTEPPAGRERPPETFDQLMEQQADTARDIARADKTNWDGNYEAVRERGLRGRARWTGKLQYDNERVLGRLRDMYDRAGQHHDEATLIGYRTAMRTMLHENAHLLTAQGTTHMQGKVQFEDQPGTRALEEGITELWAQRNLDRYIERLGVERVAPGINAVQEEQSYERYTPAAAALVRGVAEQSGQHPDEVLRRMNNVHPGQKWEVAADLMYDANGLDELVPPERRTEVTRNIANAMRNGFEQNHPDLQGREARPDRYAEAGRAAVASAQKEADLYRATYGGGDLDVGRQRGQQQNRGREQGGETSRGGGQLSDLDHAMALYNSAAPPLSTTRPLDPSRFGSRREASVETAQPQRQGPELGK